METQTIHIVGTGPAALMAGTQFALRGFKVIFFDQKPAPARKFLVAGHGGFNLTHSESIESFVEKYNQELIQDVVRTYTNKDFIRFLKDIGIETYIGSSGKIFPIKGIKPIQVLQAWIDFLTNLKAEFYYSHQLIDFSQDTLHFRIANEIITINYQKAILALGGGSWKKTGSTGEWLELFQSKGIECIDFEASNSGFIIANWDKNHQFEGEIIKNCLVKLNGIEKFGEVVLTAYGLEGSPIYFLNKAYRIHRKSDLIIDFKPTKSLTEIKVILEKSKTNSEGLKNLKLSKSVQQFIKQNTSKEEFSDKSKLAKVIKNFNFSIDSLRPIDEVISTIGGVSLNAINSNFSLKAYPSIFVCGEMLNWDAPTGGYLIQACVSMGYCVGNN